MRGGGGRSSRVSSLTGGQHRIQRCAVLGGKTTAWAVPHSLLAAPLNMQRWKWLQGPAKRPNAGLSRTRVVVRCTLHHSAHLEVLREFGVVQLLVVRLGVQRAPADGAQGNRRHITAWHCGTRPCICPALQCHQVPPRAPQQSSCSLQQQSRWHMLHTSNPASTTHQQSGRAQSSKPHGPHLRRSMRRSDLTSSVILVAGRSNQPLPAVSGAVLRAAFARACSSGGGTCRLSFPPRRTTCTPGTPAAAAAAAVWPLLPPRCRCC